MKHKIITFFFLITLGFFYNLFFIESSQAIGCAKANGGIIAKDQAISAQVQTYTEGSDDIPAMYNYADGYVDDEFSSNNTNACNEMPDFYGVLIYRLALCREDPYVSAANPVLTSCVDIINKPDNDTFTEIEPDTETNLLSLMDGDLIIPTGTYPYAFVVVKNELKVKHVQKYVDIDGDPAVMYGLDPNSADGITGQYCYTLDKVTTYSGDLWDSDYRAAHGVGTIVQSGTGSNATMACTNDLDTANTNQRYATEIIDHLGGDISSVKTDLTSYADYSDQTGTNLGISFAAYMLKEDGLVLADNVDNAVRIAAIFNYTSPIVINEQTVGIKFDFGTTLGSSLDSSVDDQDNNDISDDVTWMNKVGVDPFIVKIATKKRRRATGSTGDWR